jgi:hypothetical protein
MDLAFGPPVDWDALDDAMRLASLLDDDFCLLDYGDGRIDRFIRGILPLPVTGLGDAFHFAVWVSVSEKSWNVYREGFEGRGYAEPGCFGYLMNEIPDYPGSFLLHVDVLFNDDGWRPTVELHEVAHPLVAAQHDGVAIAQIERWAALTHVQ